MDIPVPKNELKAIEVSLRKWLNPVEFGSIVNRLNERMPNKQFQRQAGLQFFREAINAADFAKAIDCELVRLCAGNWPDFETCKGGIKKGYELMEVMEKDRKRGDEDWDSNKVEFVPVGRWHKEAEMIPRELRKAVAKKVAKNYSSNMSGLVIYLNLGSFNTHELESRTVSDFHHATELAKNKFKEIWIAWVGKHYLLWSDGEASDKVFPATLNLQATA